MNELGKRLDELARKATIHRELTNPSAKLTRNARPRRRAVIVAAIVIVGLLAGTLALWQRTDSAPTAVVAAQGQDPAEALEGECSLDSILEVLRSGLSTLDYQPAGSYSVLADNSQAVVTGRVATAVRVTTNGRSFIELTVQEVRDLTGEARPDVDVVAYDADWAKSADADPLAETVSFDDLHFIAFLSPWSGVRGGWAPGPEGLYMSCGTSDPVEPVLNEAAGPRDPASVTLPELRARIGAHLLQVEREAESAAAEAVRIAAQQAAAMEPAPLTDVTEAKALWDTAEIGDYRFQYLVLTTMGMGSLVEVLVEDGVLTEIDVRRDGAEPALGWTVDDIFDLIESADEVREGLFDPTRGYPTQVSVDPDLAVVDDELSITVIELFSVTEIENAATDLEGWFPEPVQVPNALNDLLERMESHPMNSTATGDPYLLHADRDIEIYLFHNLDRLCLVTATRTTELEATGYGGGGSSCQSDTEFARDGNWTAATNDFGERSYLVIVPPARYLNESWHVEVPSRRGNHIDLTERSALVTFDEQGPEEDVVATVRCECGDLTYKFQLMAAD